MSEQTTTWNATYFEALTKRATEAIAAAWDDAMDVGCWEHGGYETLAEAVVREFFVKGQNL